MLEEKENVIPEGNSPSKHLHDDRNTTRTPSEFSPRAITTIIGSFLSLFISVGFMNAFGLFLEYYHTHQLRSKSEFDIAWIGSFATFMLFASGAPAGLLVDKIGPMPLIGGGSIGLILGVFMTSLCNQYYQFFLAQGLLMGCSMAFLTIPCVATLSRYFVKHRGLATGLCISGSSMGGVVWPIVCDQLLNHHDMSFGWTMRVNGFIMVPIAAVATFAIRSPEVPIVPPESAKEASGTGENVPTKKKADLSILRKPAYLVFVAGTTIFNLGMFSPFFFTTAYSVSLGHSASFSFYVLSAMNGASLFGRIAVGVLADKFGAFNLTSMAAFIGAIVCYCWTAATTVGGISIWSVAYGFSSGAILSLQMQCAAAISTKETYGTAIGLCMGFASIAGLVGTPISGELIPHGYLALSMYAASTLLAASLFIAAARIMQTRKLWVKV